MIEKTCEYCGKKYYKSPSQAKRSRFCSRSCNSKYHGRLQTAAATETRVCPICGNEYQTTNHHGGRKTCSKKCANIRKAQILSEARRKPKVRVQCAQCGKELERFPSRVDGRTHFCSQECKHEYQKGRPSRPATEYIETECAHCGKPVKRFKSRTSKNGHYFCSQHCYLSYTGTSSIEDATADWLQSHGLAFQRQIRLGRYTIDFCVGNVYVEVNGCYWHGCPDHCPNPTSKRIKKRIKRDARLREYCQKRDIKLLMIWEHDIKDANFESLYSLLQASLPIF